MQSIKIIKKIYLEVSYNLLVFLEFVLMEHHILGISANKRVYILKYKL